MNASHSWPRISYCATYFYRRIVPWLILAVYAAVLLATFFATFRQPWQDLLKLFFAATGVCLAATAVWWFDFWRCCDDVWDTGSSLVVRRGKIEDRIDLAQISDIRRSLHVRPERLTLDLSRPSKLGPRIHFLVPYRHFPWGPPPMFTSLNERIEVARTQHVTDAATREPQGAGQSPLTANSFRILTAGQRAARYRPRLTALDWVTNWRRQDLRST